MKVVKCDKDHFYDADTYSECPHCKNGLKKYKKEEFEGELDYGTVSQSIDVMPIVSEEKEVDPDKTEVMTMYEETTVL